MKRFKGFTLIELLVVISIIALLMSILIPALNKAKGLARKITCMSNMKQVGIALVAYTVANNDRYPCHNITGNPGPMFGKTEFEVASTETWWGLIAPYIQFHDSKIGTSATLGERMGADSVGHCPNHKFEMELVSGNLARTDQRTSFSYSGNPNMFLSARKIGGGPSAIPGKPALKASQVVSIQDKIIIVELHNQSDWPLNNGAAYRGKWNEHTGWWTYDDDHGWAATHSRVLNYLYCDGHADSVDHMQKLEKEFYPSGKR